MRFFWLTADKASGCIVPMVVAAATIFPLTKAPPSRILFKQLNSNTFLSRVVEGKALRNHSNRPGNGRQVLNPAVRQDERGAQAIASVKGPFSSNE
jgi:hypothetical protein